MPAQLWHDVRLNFVFCQANREEFPAFIDFVAGRWPVGTSPTDIRIVFSFVGSHTDVVPRSRALIPSFTEIMPSLLAGLTRARESLIDHGDDSFSWWQRA